MNDIKPFYLDLNKEEKISLEETFRKILDSGQLILGKYTQEFESKFAEYCGSKYAVALNSGTSALEAMLIYFNVKGKKIAVPTNTNFASVVTILRNGAKPIFLDMEPDYFAPSLDNLKYIHKKYKIDGLMWVHIAGIITPDFDKIVEFCNVNNVLLIEDCAHAHGSKFQNKHAGTFGAGGAFSFFPTKVMTTIEGGMITTNNEDLAKISKSIRNQGKRDGNYGGLHYDMGSSWRISEVSASIGLLQLNKLNNMIEVRSQNTNELTKLFDNMNLQYCSTKHMDSASHYKLILIMESEREAEEIKMKAREKGIFFGGGVYEVPCHKHPVFSDILYEKNEVKNSEIWCPRQVCPPITSGTTKDQIKIIKEFIEDYFNG